MVLELQAGEIRSAERRRQGAALPATSRDWSPPIPRAAGRWRKATDCGPRTCISGFPRPGREDGAGSREDMISPASGSWKDANKQEWDLLYRAPDSR